MVLSLKECLAVDWIVYWSLSAQKSAQVFRLQGRTCYDWVNIIVAFSLLRRLIMSGNFVFGDYEIIAAVQYLKTDLVEVILGHYVLFHDERLAFNSITMLR